MSDFTVHGFVGRFPLFLLDRGVRPSLQPGRVEPGVCYTLLRGRDVALAIFTDEDLARRALAALGDDGRGAVIVSMESPGSLARMLVEQQGATHITFDPDLERMTAGPFVPLTKAVVAFWTADREQPV